MINVLWEHGPIKGQIEIINWKKPKVIQSFEVGEPCRLEIAIPKDANVKQGSPEATLISLVGIPHPFTFYIRDVSSDYPIYIPEYSVVVTTANDNRTYEEITKSIRDMKQLRYLEQIELLPEENYENAAASTLKLHCETWLGVSRDVRVFGVDFRSENQRYWDTVKPRCHSKLITLDEANGAMVQYNYMVGRGIGCKSEMKRHLEDEVLPILHGELTDGGLNYDITSFASLLQSPLTLENLRGTHYLVADCSGGECNFSDSQAEEEAKIHDRELNETEITVLCTRVLISNPTPTAKYGWFKAPYVDRVHVTADKIKYHYDLENGYGVLTDTGRVFCAATLNGKPLPKEELAVIVPPHATMHIDFFIPHSPLSADEAKKLKEISFDERLKQCRDFWYQKLADGAFVSIPEKRIGDMMIAGLLHLDLTTYGLEPGDPVGATAGGCYTTIGSESWPIIQYFDSMGWHDLARRCCEYYLAKQREDGEIQGFGTYKVETAAAIWSIGEHYLYTRDNKWATSIKDKVLKACNYMIDWKNRNCDENLRGQGYGMLDGKIADTEDGVNRIFMLNSFTYMAFKNISLMFRDTDSELANKLERHASELRCNIRTAFYENIARGLVIPLNDGTWTPSPGPWAGAMGPKCLDQDPNNFYTHANFTARDSHIMWTVFLNVINYDELATEMMMNMCTELYHEKNVRFSQPYYNRQPSIHLYRGETKAFLMNYYNAMASLADRETYSFWEHYVHASPHKTHEEGCFLMETRWMLYLEDGDTLKLMTGIPRKWLENGEEIVLDKVGSHFGELSVKVTSEIDSGSIRATVTCKSPNKPSNVIVRLPHPLAVKAKSVNGGIYMPKNESVLVEKFDGTAEVSINF